MKFKDYLNVDMITEMANVDDTYHDIRNIKMNVRQPGDKLYAHDISIKVFKGKNINDSMIVGINRNTNVLTIHRNTKHLTKKEQKNSMSFIQKNVLNFINLWDDPTLSLNEVQWA